MISSFSRWICISQAPRWRDRALNNSLPSWLLTPALGTHTYLVPQQTMGNDSDNFGCSERARRAANREILKTEPPGSMLRISVQGGGCSGFQYKFDFVGTKEDDDLVVSRDEATVLVDPVSAQYMAGAEIDFVDDLIGASFKINNPIATASCGCGTSFSI